MYKVLTPSNKTPFYGLTEEVGTSVTHESSVGKGLTLYVRTYDPPPCCNMLSTIARRPYLSGCLCIEINGLVSIRIMTMPDVLNPLPTNDAYMRHEPIRIYMGGLILGVNTLYRLFCFFKLFPMVGKGLTRGVRVHHIMFCIPLGALGVAYTCTLIKVFEISLFSYWS